MKKIISALMVLCLLAACCPAWAEEAPSLGKPWANPNMYTAFPARPGPEENYYIWANYDLLAQAAAATIPEASLGYQTAQSLADQFLDICTNPEYTDADSQILQILYKMISDTEKRERETFADLMARVDRVKAVTTAEELTGLMLEEGFLLENPFFLCFLQKSVLDRNRAVISVARKNPAGIPADVGRSHGRRNDERPADRQGNAPQRTAAHALQRGGSRQDHRRDGKV